MERIDCGKIEIDLQQRHGQPVDEVSLKTAETEFLVRHAKCGDLLEVSRGKPDETHLAQLMPAQSDDPVQLMNQELFRGGAHRVYLRAAHYFRRSS